MHRHKNGKSRCGFCERKIDEKDTVGGGGYDGYCCHEHRYCVRCWFDKMVNDPSYGMRNKLYKTKCKACRKHMAPFNPAWRGKNKRVRNARRHWPKHLENEVIVIE